MATTLTLDTPGATEALARAYALLWRWAAEAREQETGIGDDLGGTTPTPAYTPAPKWAGRRGKDSTMTKKTQTRQRKTPRAILSPMIETAHRNGWHVIYYALRDLLTKWEARQYCTGGGRNER